MKTLLLMIVAMIAIMLTPRLTVAGTLDDFERDSTSAQPEKSRSSTPVPTLSKNRNCDEKRNTDDVCWESLFIDLIEHVFLHGTQVTIDRTSPFQTTDGITERNAGNPLLPTFRANGNWQSIDPNLTGRDVSVEAGHSLFSIKLRRTNLVERNPTDSLSLSYGHVLYRLSYGNTLEVGLGLGRATLSGNIKTTGTSFTIPTFWQLSNNFGFEFSQTYSDFNGITVSDFDGGLMYFKNNMATSIGYRMVFNPASSLSGPYLGISLIY